MKKALKSDKAPKAIGPYSQAIRAGQFVFISGQIPLSASGEPVRGDIKHQTSQVLENIKAILQSEGMSLENVVKTTVFLKHMKDFAAMNEVYAECFKESPPARSTVEVSGLPRDVDIEIEAVAVLS